MENNALPVKLNGEVNYCCTWASQNFVAKNRGFASGLVLKDFEGAKGACLARSEMNEETVFGEGGFAHMLEGFRGDLYLVFDDGWDVAYGAADDGDISSFGSLILNNDRFPSFTGEPRERLKAINDKLKAMGWRGLGIWVSPQMHGEDHNVSFDDDPEKHKAYWTERLLWCKYAGVRYWKVDWGKNAKVDYRRMMTELGKEVYPELVMEQARCMVPVNGDIDKGKVRFADAEDTYNKTKATLSFSEVFRSYDVTDDMLSATSTLDRLTAMLPHAAGVINCEDELYIAVALGCAIGIMRSSYGKDYFRMNRRLDEIGAAVRWSREAPSFAGGELKVSDDLLDDNQYFTEDDTWYTKIMNKTVTQRAPAVVARNTELPDVERYESMPFVIASANPTGAYTVAAIKRRQYLFDTKAPSVTCSVGKAARVGVFGDFESLTLRVDAPVKKISAYSLIGDATEALSLSEYADGSIVRIDRALFERLNRVTDESDNAVALAFEF